MDLFPLDDGFCWIHSLPCQVFSHFSVFQVIKSALFLKKKKKTKHYLASFKSTSSMLRRKPTRIELKETDAVWETPDCQVLVLIGAAFRRRSNRPKLQGKPLAPDRSHQQHRHVRGPQPHSKEMVTTQPNTTPSRQHIFWSHTHHATATTLSCFNLPNSKPGHKSHEHPWTPVKNHLHLAPYGDNLPPLLGQSASISASSTTEQGIYLWGCNHWSGATVL